MTSASPQSSGIIPRSYKSGSIIYFENDKSEYCYVLKSGRVILTSIKLDTGEEVKEEVRVGEFFGVKSALGKYPREETAQTIGETVVLVFPLVEFERLVLRNANVVRKMLRVFSNQLRRIGKMVRSVMGEDDSINPDEELYKIGEYYYKTGAQPHALYVFKRYMEYYPDTENAALAMKRIKSIESGQMGMNNDLEMSSETSSGMSSSSFDNGGDDDFSFDIPADEEPMFSFDENSDSTDTLTGEMDTFLADNDAMEDFSDFSLDEEVVATPSGGSSISSAISACGSGNFQECMDMCNKLLQGGAVSGDDAEKAHLYKAHALKGLNNTKDALQAYSSFIKDNPTSAHVKEAIFNVGEIFDNAGQRDKALGYYKKVSTFEPADEFTRRAQDKVNQLGA